MVCIILLTQNNINCCDTSFLDLPEEFKLVLGFLQCFNMSFLLLGELLLLLLQRRHLKKENITFD